MDIINITHYQLSKIEELIKEELEVGVLTKDYFICEDKCKFLAKYELQTYLTERTITNLTFLKSINRKCNIIIDLFNKKLSKFPVKKFSKPFLVLNNENGIIINTVYDFHAIYLNKNNFEIYDTEIEKREFFKEFRYNMYSIENIAIRCNLILSWIYASYPETKIEVIELTKAQVLIRELNIYGFSNLDMVKGINEYELIDNIASNKLPYQIAYLDFLGFIQMLNENYCKSFTELHNLIGKILNTKERAVRGNINGLKNEMSLDRKRYTAYQHVESVKEHYQKLK